MGKEGGESEAGSEYLKREKLKQALIHKLVKKYSPNIERSQTEAFIHKQVELLLRHQKVSPEDLSDLEGRIRSFASAECQDIILVPFKTVYQKTVGGVDEWGLLNDFQRGLVSSEAHARKERQRLLKEQTKTQLDQQLAELAEAKERERSQKLRETEDMHLQTNAFMQEQAALRQERKAKLEAERKAREAEMAAVNERREFERQQRRSEDMQQLEIAKAALEEEQKKYFNRRVQMQQKLQNWKAETEVIQTQKQASKVAQRNAEKEEALAALRLLDQQERKREEELNRLKERMKGRELMGMRVAAAESNKAHEDEMKMQVAQQELRDRAENEFRRRLSEKEQKKREMIRVLDAQIEETRKQRERAQALESEQARLFRAAAEDQLVAEIAKRDEKRKQLQHYRAALEDQIRARLRVKNEYMSMNETERQLNRKFLPQLGSPNGHNSVGFNSNYSFKNSPTSPSPLQQSFYSPSPTKKK